MRYTNIMVNLELGQTNTALLEIAGDLAEIFQAGVTGTAAAQPMHIVYGDGVYTCEDLISFQRLQTDAAMAAAEQELRDSLQLRAKSLDWRPILTMDALGRAVADEARCADLVITSADRNTLLHAKPGATAGELLMQLGVPLFVVPPGIDGFSLHKVVVAWKDTSESRRAIHDALPLLHHATGVRLVEIASADAIDAAGERLNDVAHWLKRHGITADVLAVRSTGDDAVHLSGLLDEHDADVVVAGAYGHSRLHDWVFGGVTRDVVLHGKRCALASH